MKPSSPRKADRFGFGPLSLSVVPALLLATAAEAATVRDGQPGQTLQAQERRIVIEPQAPVAGEANRINTSGRAVTLTVPAKDGAVYLGDIVVTIDPADRLEFSAQRLLDLLANVVDSDVLRTLQGNFGGRATLTPLDFQASGIGIRYNPRDLALELDIASERRASRSVQVSPLDRDQIGTFVAPADVSAYLNVRGNLDYLWDGPGNGLQSPILFLDGAARIGGVVAEGEAVWSPGGNGEDFQRLGSRLVYDDIGSLARWTAGDLQPVGRGFQSVPDLAGFSVFRSYSVLQPQQIVRPRGDRSFRLDRAATVEVQVNGQSVRRLQLQPGTYNLRDFPFTQGANDIRLNILDDAGRSEVLRFNVFLDQSQLAKGLTEFGVYAGVMAPLADFGPDYTDDPAVTAFVRHGVNDFITAGANVQADETVQMGGVEGVFATGFGTISANFSISNLDGFGMGRGALVTFQRLIQRSGGRADSLSLFFESRSRNFAALGSTIANNPFEWEVGGGYSHAFSDYVYGGIDGRYSNGRDAQRDVWNLRGTLGWRFSDAVSFTGDVRYERDTIGERLAGLVSVTVRLGRYSNARADYDTRFNRARASLNTFRGTGVGAYNLSADVERSDFGSGVNFVGNYYANRAELGASHFGTFDNDFGASISQRTSLRLATSLAFADGGFSVGRPIYDSFAIVRGHRALDRANILVDPSPFGYVAATGLLNAATQSSLSAYAERTITVDAPSAPAGFDLGQGSFRLFPAYRSGYLLKVGSDYNVTATGRLLNRDGEPISLLTGAASELAHPDREAITIFTNREGRFGATGLAPGRWRIVMNDDQRSTFLIDVPNDGQNILRVGDLRPTESNR